MRSDPLHTGSVKNGPKRPHAVWSLLFTLLALLTISTVLSAPAAQATPGTPGIPQPPVAIYTEDFQQGSGITPLTAYTPSSGTGYTADSYWLNQYRCNGFVASYQDAFVPMTSYCNGFATTIDNIRAEAEALGILAGKVTPQANRVVAGGTAGALDVPLPYAPDGPVALNSQQFATQSQLTLPAAHRFLTLSVDAAATACNLPVAAPLLRPYLKTSSGAELPVSAAAINPCTDPASQSLTVNDPSLSVNGALVRYGRFVGSASQLMPDNSVGLVIRNEGLTSVGNDGAFGNLRVLDVTPQLDLALSPGVVPAGATSTLTFTVTNTSELSQKAGWSFTNVLPAGLVVANSPTVGGTCPATVNATAGSSTVSVTGGTLGSGVASCTLTVKVRSNVSAGLAASTQNYQNCPANLTQADGVNPPACASVTFAPTVSGLAFSQSVDTTALTTPAQPGETLTYQLTASNTGNVPLSGVTMTDTLGDLSTTLTYTWPGASGVLLPGQSVTASGRYSLTQADLDAGQVVNPASASGTLPGGSGLQSAQVQLSTPLPGTAALSFSQSVDVSTLGSPVQPGRVMTYRLTAKNTGNVSLSGVAFKDALSGLSPLTYSWPGAAGVLLPGQSVTASGRYALTQTDLDAGQVVNPATVSGTTPAGGTLSPAQSSVVVGFSAGSSGSSSSGGRGPGLSSGSWFGADGTLGGLGGGTGSAAGGLGSGAANGQGAGSALAATGVASPQWATMGLLVLLLGAALVSAARTARWKGFR
ncbi:DUF7507 domain-containing protein [Psychromicrobium xiongbiense]|uniref:DUF7507 domain-containing protein n=1 Tax=Psychromicrobium xiongbiense TaxID=3051184 RepID=UPI0025561227|nr:hypothetical protein [Psychromicrobium sp. YIM S02556]